ncbi:MAG: magnesium/cobalt transporter CorA [Pseudomonadota bacterium]|nr:magnesium/cobalt transporter CorA [Pseudomonadota bacterium]
MAYFTKDYHPPGTSPGTLISRETSTTPLSFHLIDYNDHDFTEEQLDNAAACKQYLAQESTTWIHVQGLPQPEQLREMGALFGLHELALEDVLHDGQRPKIDEYEQQLFITLAVPLGSAEQIEITQLSLFIGDNYLISFYAGPDGLFDLIRKRLRNHGGRIRSLKADYLLYTLLDLVVDMGFPLLEEFGNLIETLEDNLLESPSRSTLGQIHVVRRELLQLRRMIWPQREVVNRLMHDDHPLIQQTTHVYLRDCYDHSIQIMDLLENYRDMASSMLDVYLSSVSNRLNDTMRVLTLISTIFMPLTFITGLYGMNFGNNTHSPWAMPELNWYYGYPMAWGIMITVVAIMFVFFKRKGWLQRNSDINER